MNEESYQHQSCSRTCIEGWGESHLLRACGDIPEYPEPINLYVRQQNCDVFMKVTALSQKHVEEWPDDSASVTYEQVRF